MKNPVAVNKTVIVGHILPVTGTPEPVEGFALLRTDVGVGDVVVVVGVIAGARVVVGVRVEAEVGVGDVVVVVGVIAEVTTGVAEAEAVKAKPVSVNKAILNVRETLSVAL